MYALAKSVAFSLLDDELPSDVAPLKVEDCVGACVLFVDTDGLHEDACGLRVDACGLSATAAVTASALEFAAISTASPAAPALASPKNRARRQSKGVATNGVAQVGGQLPRCGAEVQDVHRTMARREPLRGRFVPIRC